MKKTTEKKSRAKFKEGDLIKIDVPEFFIRCGYPQCLDDVVKEITVKHGLEIMKLVEKIAGGAVMEGSRQGNAVSQIHRSLAYIKMHANRFGGNERSIYTKTVPQWKDKECIVKSIRYVKTGEYVRPIAGGWSNDGEHDPPFLANERTHRILETDIQNSDWESWKSYLLWIEDIYVTKVKQS